MSKIESLQYFLDNPVAEYALDVKVEGKWFCLMHHECKEMLKDIGLRQFSRHKKQRIRKIR